MGPRARIADRQESARYERRGHAAWGVLQATFKPRTENDVTTEKKVAHRKLRLLELDCSISSPRTARNGKGFGCRSGATIGGNFACVADPGGCTLADSTIDGNVQVDNTGTSCR